MANLKSMKFGTPSSLLEAAAAGAGPVFGPPGTPQPQLDLTISLQAVLDPGISVGSMLYQVSLDAGAHWHTLQTKNLVTTPFSTFVVPGAGSQHRLKMDTYTGNDVTKTIDTVVNSGAVRAANVVTIKTTVAHAFVVGQTVVIAGVTNATFNGSFVILTQDGANQFTYAQVAADATSGGGTATVATSLEVFGLLQ